MHARPIDLVVFQEPMQHLLRETSSWRGLALDAFRLILSRPGYPAMP